MGEFFQRLFDPTGFTPRRSCGIWSDELIWLHIGADLFIWLAYVSIPLLILWYARRWTLRPGRWLIVLFATFILSCGFTHFIDALMFSYPMYRLSGFVKLLTAVVSWATVIALIPLVPRVLAALDHEATIVPEAETTRPRWVDYAVAVLAAGMALLVRQLFDPLLEDQHAFVFALIAVLVSGWIGGLRPSLVALILGFLGTIYFFVEPHGSFLVPRLSDQLGVALFFFGGFGIAVLAASERRNRRRAIASLQDALNQRDALRVEVTRRIEVEARLRQRTEELTLAQQEAAQAQFQYRTVLEAMPQMVWVMAPDGANEYYNQRWQQYTGMTIEQCLANQWTDRLHPEDHTTVRLRWQQARESGSDYEIEYRLRGVDGQYRWFLARAVPTRNQAGEIVRWFGTCTDIDSSKQLEEELRQSTNRFRSLTEAIPLPVWTADPTGRITYFNQRWHQFTGTAVEEVTGPDGVRVIHPDDRERLNATWTHAVQSEAGSYSCEFRLRHKDGGHFWHLSTALPLRTRDGATTGWVGSLTNIHDQKAQAEVLERQVAERTESLLQLAEERGRAEVRAQAMARELERSNRELEAFASVASHDLQEPLRKILAFGDRLAQSQRERLDAQGVEDLQRITGAAGRMRQLIEDLLTYSRVTTRARPFRMVDLNQVLREVLSDLEIRIAQTGAKIEAEPLPCIQADPLQMRQLLQNLVANALKFTPHGVAPLVGIRTEPHVGDSDAVRLLVSDRGIGFEPRYLDRIFHLFQRLHGRSEYEGTGIGLAICKKIADRHGGTITARSLPGQGATFVVDLPRVQPQGEGANK